MSPGSNRRGILVSLLSAGCVSPDGRPGQDSGFSTDYVVGALYRIRQDRLIEQPGTLSQTYVLKPPHLINAAPGPATVSAYLANPSRWPTVRGVVSAGARLRVTRLSRRDSWLGLEGVGEVYAEILDGPSAGMIVELSFISRNVQQSEPPTRSQWVDPAELEMIE